ncbi:hypothetical protein RMATCC62417_03811 [Rhizopus microsporus]|nr:hypothetical protein RMATCC62417_03811 [Rhizopus microsporus]
MRKKITGTFTVMAVILFITFIAYTSQIFIIWPHITASTSLVQSICILAPLNLLIIMVYIHYLLTCFTHPGSVPSRYIPRQQAYVEVKKSTHTPRFCKTCNNYKPPRTHHCSVCDQCVLKMDHHCPWVNNCVGYFNYCHFIRFIVCVDITSIYIFALLCYRLNDIVQHHLHPAPPEIIFLTLNLMGLVVAIIGVGVLTCYHVYCITTNTTTIEGWEKGRSLTIKGMGRIQHVKAPYDQGIYENIATVLGKYPFFWLLPIPMRGNGLDFPIKVGNSLHATSSTTQLNRPVSVETFWSVNTATTMTPLKSIAQPQSSFVSNATTIV